MNIAILGAGNIGQTMGVKWVQAGHEVVFGVRDPASPKTQALLAAYPQAKLVGLAQASASAEVILVSLPFTAVREALAPLAASLAGKILIDATNDFNAAVGNNIRTLQELAPGAQVFRAFNSLGWEIFARPQFGEQAVDHFYCGPDTAQRQLVEQLIAEIGVHPIWVGGLELAHIVDALGSLWVTLAFRRGYGRQQALKLLSR